MHRHHWQTVSLAVVGLAAIVFWHGTSWQSTRASRSSIEYSTSTIKIHPAMQFDEDDAQITHVLLQQKTDDNKSTESKGKKDKIDLLKIEPYTGPPIYLEEPPTPPPATVAERGIKRSQKYKNGEVHVERTIMRYSDDTRINHGPYKEYHPNGQIFSEGQFTLGIYSGEWKYSHDNGKPCKTVTYKKGQPDGAWDVLRADGTIQAHREFKAGKKNGEWASYDDAGKTKLSHQSYADNKPAGEWKTWYPSGQQKAVAHFKDGKRNGLIQEWAEDGEEIGSAEFVDGKLHGLRISWGPDGKRREQQFKEGRLVPKE